MSVDHRPVLQPTAVKTLRDKAAVGIFLKWKHLRKATYAAVSEGDVLFDSLPPTVLVPCICS